MILDQYNEGLIMEEKDTSNQYLYTLDIPANTLVVGNKIRLKATVHIAEAIPPDCDPCTATTDPGEQTIGLIHSYSYSTGIPQGTLSGNNAGQLNYIGNLGTKEEFIIVAGSRSGSGTSYDAPNIIGVRDNHSNWQVLHFEGVMGQNVGAVNLPNGIVLQGGIITTDAKSGFSGHSQEMSYLLYYTRLTPAPAQEFIGYFNYTDDEVTLMTPYPGFTLPQSWTKFDDAIFGIALGFGTEEGIFRWPLIFGGVPVLYSAGAKHYIDVFATENYLWGLTKVPSAFEIVKLRKDTLEVITTYSLSTLSTPYSMVIIEDKAAYIYDSAGAIYYMLFSEGVVRKISDIAYNGGSIMHYRNGYFYFHLKNFGFGSGGVGVDKFGPLNCPGTQIAIGS